MSEPIVARPVTRTLGAPPRALVLAGPAGVGKSTVVRALREALPELYFSISVTTRDPRPGEMDGRDYFFITPERFAQLIDEDALLEWAEIHGGLQRSGTPAGPVRDALEGGRPVLIEVDLAGARSLRRTLPEAVSVFLAPPSWDELVHRLTGRGTESPEQIERRLASAREELAARDEFDAVIVNDSVQDTTAQLVALLVEP